MEKKNIIIIVLSVLVIGLFGYIVYDKILDNKEEIVDNTKPNDNNVNDKNDNVKDDNDNVSDENIEDNNKPIVKEKKNIFTNYMGALGWVAYVSLVSNEDDSELFSDTYYKQLFVMENIIKNEGEEKFIKIAPENGPCCQYYYPYEQFAEVYFNNFTEIFNSDPVNIEGKYYVYYDFYRKFGSNGVCAENINIIDIINDGDIYIATVEIDYSEAARIDKINATIKYKKNGDKIIFKSFIVN